MSRALAIAVLLALPAIARAHSVPGSRDVVVQAEEGAVAILVTYRPATRTFVPPQPNRARLELALARRALAVLEVKLDGQPLSTAGGDLRIKLAAERGKPMVAVLISAPIAAGDHTLTVDVGQDAEPTATRWIDRSNGRVTRYGPRPPGQSFQDRGQLVVEWR